MSLIAKVLCKSSFFTGAEIDEIVFLLILERNIQFKQKCFLRCCDMYEILA